MTGVVEGFKKIFHLGQGNDLNTESGKIIQAFKKEGIDVSYEPVDQRYVINFSKQPIRDGVLVTIIQRSGINLKANQTGLKDREIVFIRDGSNNKRVDFKLVEKGIPVISLDEAKLVTHRNSVVSNDTPKGVHKGVNVTTLVSKKKWFI